MEEIKAIETNYKGYRFRSRLEARWAVFFDELGIEWEYEPQGFFLPSGKRYLPDFKLHGFCGRGPEAKGEEGILWCEVKGVKDWDDLFNRKREDYDKVEEFSNFDALDRLYEKICRDENVSHEEWEDAMRNRNSIIILPNIPKDSYEWWGSDVSSFIFVDYDEFPCIITKPNLSEKRFVLCGPDGTSYPKGDEISFTNSALLKARSARFEFSEKDLQPLENEVEMLRKRKELMDEKDQLLKQIRGGF